MKSWHSRNNSKIMLSQQEMQEISREISQTYAPTSASNSPELVLLPVDPYHLYAYWNFNQSKTGGSKKIDSDNKLTLRIYWQPNDDDITKTKLWFDVDLRNSQKQCKVRLPIDETGYYALLGRRHSDNSFAAIATSNIIHVPRGRMAPVLHKSELKSQITPAKTAKADDESTTHNYDENLIDLKIKDTLYEKGINFKFMTEKDFSVNALPDDTKAEQYDENHINSKIQHTLSGKGIAASLKSTKEISKSSNYASQNPSGQENVK